MNGFAQCHFVEDEVFGVGEFLITINSIRLQTSLPDFLVDFLKAHTCYAVFLRFATE